MKWLALAVGVVALTVAAWFIGKRGVNPLKAVRLELDVLDAKTKTKKLLVNQGISKARRQIEAEHKEAIEQFNDEQKKQARQLRSDPVALSEFLVRVGRSG